MLASIASERTRRHRRRRVEMHSSSNRLSVDKSTVTIMVNVAVQRQSAGAIVDFQPISHRRVCKLSLSRSVNILHGIKFTTLAYGATVRVTVSKRSDYFLMRLVSHADDRRHRRRLQTGELKQTPLSLQYEYCERRKLVLNMKCLLANGRHGKCQTEHRWRLFVVVHECGCQPCVNVTI